MTSFADNKINVNQNMKFDLERVEISSFPTMFSKVFFLRVVTSKDCVYSVNPFPHNDTF